MFGIAAGACLYVCLLSLFNFEKHARAGSNIAKNDRETQKAIISFSVLALIPLFSLFEHHVKEEVSRSQRRTYSFSPSPIHQRHPRSSLSFVLAF